MLKDGIIIRKKCPSIEAKKNFGVEQKGTGINNAKRGNKRNFCAYLRKKY